jgi:hypothetical protein
VAGAAGALGVAPHLCHRALMPPHAFVMGQVAGGRCAPSVDAAHVLGTAPFASFPPSELGSRRSAVAGTAQHQGATALRGPVILCIIISSSSGSRSGSSPSNWDGSSSRGVLVATQLAAAGIAAGAASKGGVQVCVGCGQRAAAWQEHHSPATLLVTPAALSSFVGQAGGVPVS